MSIPNHSKGQMVIGVNKKRKGREIKEMKQHRILHRNDKYNSQIKVHEAVYYTLTIIYTTFIRVTYTANIIQQCSGME